MPEPMGIASNFTKTQRCLVSRVPSTKLLVLAKEMYTVKAKGTFMGIFQIIYPVSAGHQVTRRIAINQKMFVKAKDLRITCRI